MSTSNPVMTPMRGDSYATAERQRSQPVFDEVGGSGWLVFAGIVLLVAGTMRIFDAIWAFSYHGAVPQNLENALFGQSLSTYGWLWLAVGIVLFVCGAAVMVRSQIARWIGVFGGVIGTISAIWWMPYYPIWSIVYVGLGVLVVYALVAHGERRPVVRT